MFQLLNAFKYFDPEKAPWQEEAIKEFWEKIEKLSEENPELNTAKIEFIKKFRNEVLAPATAHKAKKNIANKAIFHFSPRKSRELLFGIFELLDERGNSLIRAKASSGQPGMQSSGDFWVRGRGLIPPYDRYKIRIEGYFLPNPGINGMFFHIIPDPVPHYERSELGLHLDANFEKIPGTAGCIGIVNKEDFEKIKAIFLKTLQQNVKEIPLEIDYSSILYHSGRDRDILAKTIYGEARGEIREGQIAVGYTILNRYKISLRTKGRDWWGNTIAEICQAPQQFSCWNEDDPNYKILISDRIYQDEYFHACLCIADLVLYEKEQNPIRNATHFHHKSISPFWVKGATYVETIGNHIFWENVQ